MPSAQDSVFLALLPVFAVEWITFGRFTLDH